MHMVVVVFIDGERGVPTLIVATKADKLSKSEQGLVTRRFAADLGCSPGDILLTSAMSGEGLGDHPRRGGLAAELADLIAERAPEIVTTDEGAREPERAEELAPS